MATIDMRMMRMKTSMEREIYSEWGCTEITKPPKSNRSLSDHGRRVIRCESQRSGMYGNGDQDAGEG